MRSGLIILITLAAATAYGDPKAKTLASYVGDVSSASTIDRNTRPCLTVADLVKMFSRRAGFFIEDDGNVYVGNMEGDDKDHTVVVLPIMHRNERAVTAGKTSDDTRVVVVLPTAASGASVQITLGIAQPKCESTFVLNGQRVPN